MLKNLSPSAISITGHESELIELALTYKFAGMDLNMAEFAARADSRGIDYARRLIDSAKIQVSSFPLPIDWDVEDEQFKKELEKLVPCAEVAAQIGCTRCLATVAPAGDSRPYHENFELHRRRFSEICQVLSSSGVRLGLGFQAAEYLRKNQAFQFIQDFDALTLLVKTVGSPNMGLLLDTWELAVSGATAEAIGGLSVEQIVAVQVADVPADVPADELNEQSRLLPGDENGRGESLAMLRALAQLDYDGPVTLKVSGGVFSSRQRGAVVRVASEALDKLLRLEEPVAEAASPSEAEVEATSTEVA